MWLTLVPRCSAENRLGQDDPWVAMGAERKQFEPDDGEKLLL